MIFLSNIYYIEEKKKKERKKPVASGRCRWVRRISGREPAVGALSPGPTPASIAGPLRLGSFVFFSTEVRTGSVWADRSDTRHKDVVRHYVPNNQPTSSTFLDRVRYQSADSSVPAVLLRVHIIPAFCCFFFLLSSALNGIDTALGEWIIHYYSGCYRCLRLS